MTIEECKEGDVPFRVENHDPGKSGDYVFAPKEMSFNVGDSVCLVLSAETEAPHLYGRRAGNRRRPEPGRYSQALIHL